MNNLNKYNNAKIYKICDNSNTNIYIGSTCQSLNKRMAEHRAKYKAYLSGKYDFVKSFDILKNGDYSIILIENVENCTNKEQLLRRERHYIETLDCVNKVIPGRTIKEYYIDIKETKKQYYNDNKELIKEKIKEYQKANKKTIKEYRQEKITCFHCNCEFRRDKKAKHEKTNKHKLNLTNNENI